MADPELLLTSQQAIDIFGTDRSYLPQSFQGETFAAQTRDVSLRFTGTTLGLEIADRPDGDKVFHVTGNTLVKSNIDPRGCDVAGVECSVGACGLRDMLMSNYTRREYNCSGANTIRDLGDNPRFVITPTNNDVVFLADAEAYEPFVANNEDGQEELMFGKVKPASTLVISEHDLPEGVEDIDVILNGADSSLAVTIWEFKRPGAKRGTRYAFVSCSSQPNLGDRDGDAQILAKGFEGILDREGVVDPAERAQILADSKVEIHIGFSATLKNFAHRVTVPALVTPEALEGANLAHLDEEQIKLFKGTSRDALNILRREGLIEPETGKVGKILPKHVMNYRFPGALENGEIHPGSNIGLGIMDEPYRSGGCPDDGELCHIDYMEITRRTLVGQLVGMGMNAENIHYDNSRSVDTGDKDNRLASRRLFGLADIPADRTPRSANGVTISFKKEQLVEEAGPEGYPSEAAIAAAAELLRRFPDTPEGNDGWEKFQDERWGVGSRYK